jgi:hypothetical protein
MGWPGSRDWAMDVIEIPRRYGAAAANCLGERNRFALLSSTTSTPMHFQSRVADLGKFQLPGFPAAQVLDLNLKFAPLQCALHGQSQAVALNRSNQEILRATFDRIDRLRDLSIGGQT